MVTSLDWRAKSASPHGDSTRDPSSASSLYNGAVAIQQKKLVVSAEDSGLRLDQFLVEKIGDVSRSRVQMLIDQQKVEVEGRIQKASYRLEGGEEVRVLGAVQPPPLKAQAEDIPLDIVFEDDSIAVVNKPAGMMVHAGAASAAEDESGDARTRGTLVNALLHHFDKLSKVGGSLRPGIVHRLDKDTSGLIVVAKTDSAHRKLAEQFSGRQVKKTYIALVHRWPKAEQATISQPIGRDPVKRHRMKLGGIAARDATSHYKTLAQIRTRYGRFALIEVTIETGRTHQIRVHMGSIGHPVVGDTLYGAPAEIPLLDTTQFRAHRADTKATRDRAQSDLTRELTERVMGASVSSTSKVAAKRVKSGTGKAATKTQLDKNSAGEVAIATSFDRTISLHRNFLHAAALELIHPKTGKSMKFEAKLPRELEDFQTTLKQAAM